MELIRRIHEVWIVQVESSDAGHLVYKMSSNPRSKALIINNYHFTCGMRDRIGTQHDVENLRRLFIYLSFDTTVRNDLSVEEFRESDLSSTSHTDYDCLIVAILTHGIEGNVYSTDGVLIPIATIVSMFDANSCPSLAEKPKIFIFQACRGSNFDGGAQIRDDRIVPQNEVPVEEPDGVGRQVIPSRSDYMIAYSTPTGFVPWRNSELDPGTLKPSKRPCSS